MRQVPFCQQHSPCGPTHAIDRREVPRSTGERSCTSLSTGQENHSLGTSTLVLSTLPVDDCIEDGPSDLTGIVRRKTGQPRSSLMEPHYVWRECSIACNTTIATFGQYHLLKMVRTTIWSAISQAKDYISTYAIRVAFISALSPS